MYCLYTAINGSFHECGFADATLLFAEMYEISPYATFSVPGRENRSVTTATLDYTMQFKTFGHLENEDINTIDYERSTVEFER